MKYLFFIRTYHGDAAWLVYCLRSLKKFAPDVPVIIVSDGEFPLLDEARKQPNMRVFTAAEVPETDHPSGYVAQQLTKLCADRYVERAKDLVPDGVDYVVHIDSDTVLTEGPEGLFKDCKPYMLRTPYDRLPAEVQKWKACVERHLGRPVSHEYMRRLPLVYPIGLYRTLRNALRQHHGSWRAFVASIPGKELTEFNLLGAHAFDSEFHSAFRWIDTDSDPLPDVVAKQFWSWGGIENHRAWLEENYPQGQ